MVVMRGANRVHSLMIVSPCLADAIAAAVRGNFQCVNDQAIVNTMKRIALLLLSRQWHLLRGRCS